LRLAEIRNGFFGFLARVFDSWAVFLRPRIETAPARKDPFVPTPPGPPAHWLELTAGLTFTEMGSAQTGAPGQPQIAENETRAAHLPEAPEGLPEGSAAGESTGKENRPLILEKDESARFIKPEAKKAPPGSAFTFRESGESPKRVERVERVAEDPPGTPVLQTRKKPRGPRSLAEGFLKFGRQKDEERFSPKISERTETPEINAAKFNSRGENAANTADDDAPKSRLVPVLSKEPAGMEDLPIRPVSYEAPAGTQASFPGKSSALQREEDMPPAARISQHSQPAPDNAFEALTARRSENSANPAFAAAKKDTGAPAPPAVFPDTHRPGISPAANFIAPPAAERFPEINAAVPAKNFRQPDAAAFVETRKQDKPREFDEFASAVPVPAKPQNGFGRGFVGRGDQAKNFPQLPAIDNGSKWADLPELELGGAPAGAEADHLRLKHLAELEREQKGERWSV